MFMCTDNKGVFFKGYFILVSHKIFDFLWGVFYSEWYRWPHSSKFTTILNLFYLRPKLAFHCRLFDAVLIVSNMTPKMAHPVVPHENSV